MKNILYFKVITSNKKTKIDNIGCDGLYIKSCKKIDFDFEKCYNDLILLKDKEKQSIINILKLNFK